MNAVMKLRFHERRGFVWAAERPLGSQRGVLLEAVNYFNTIPVAIKRKLTTAGNDFVFLI